MSTYAFATGFRARAPVLLAGSWFVLRLLPLLALVSETLLLPSTPPSSLGQFGLSFRIDK